MKLSFVPIRSTILLITAICMIGLIGCNMAYSSQEPMTWIDQPLEGAQLPLAPVIIQAHAADADGIASIEFLLFDNLIASVPKGGTRMENASLEWKPQKPGKYTINVRAIDSQGNTNVRSMAKVNITIGSENAYTDTPSPMVSFTPSPWKSYTPATALIFTPSPNNIEKPILTLTIASNPTFTLQQNANCRRGPATVFDSVDAIIQGTSVAIEGRTSDNAWFWVRKPSGSGNCWVSAVTGTTNGNWQVIPVKAAPSLPTTTSAPVDRTPPEISDLSSNPTIISVQTQCGDTPPTTVIRAQVTDPGGIAHVTARISGVGEFEMSLVGNDNYQKILGPFSDAGTLSIFVQAQDSAGNTATSAPISVQVIACPG